jgi:DNA-binding NarL/FixJ family response regulator
MIDKGLPLNEQDHPPTKPLRILIADDHAFFRRGLREVIDDEPDMCVIAEASDGDQAIRRARELRPNRLDLILMDIDMPGIDGIKATERITTEDPDLPIVILTVSTLDRNLFDAVRVGAIGFLSKSLAPDALIRALRSYHRDQALPMSAVMAARVLSYLQKELPKNHPVEPPQVTLTPRESEVLEHIRRGARDHEIAASLVVSESTVKKHVQNILRKLHARNRVEAITRVREIRS